MKNRTKRTLLQAATAVAAVCAAATILLPAAALAAPALPGRLAVPTQTQFQPFQNSSLTVSPPSDVDREISSIRTR
jgi:hypothetical protein